MVEASGPGTLTRWLGVPWQTDEASCLAGYEPGTYLELPSFWAARVPNFVLSERAFERVVNSSLSTPQRFKHFNHRAEWLRFFGPNYLRRIARNVTDWHRVGIIAERLGPADFAVVGLPRQMWVESEVDPALTLADATWAQLAIAESGPPIMGMGATAAEGVAAAESVTTQAAEQLDREAGQVPTGRGRQRLRRDEM
jgi:hypothetical protein